MLKKSASLMSFIVCCIAVLISSPVSGTANKNHGSRPFQYSTTASFVKPAAPPSATTRRSQTLSWFVPAPPRLQRPSASSTTSSIKTALYSKKKKKAGGAGATAATKKIQVKMLKHVASTGQAGQVVMVTPAFYNNKLRPSKSAQIISDDEVQQQQEEEQKLRAEMQARAMAVKEKLEEKNEEEESASPFLQMKRKAGPGGQLFGGIGAKNLIAELQDHLNLDDSDKGFLGKKGIKVTALMDENGKKMRGDIKHTGEYSATISLLSDVSAKFGISVTADE